MRIAICDDEKIFVEKVYSILRNLMSQEDVIKTYTSGLELQEEQIKNPYDLILLDINMPDVDGLTIAQNIKIRNENTYIIFVTGYDSYVYDSMKIRPYDFIRKSRVDVEIPKTITRFLKDIERKSYVFEFSYDSSKHAVRIEDVMFFKGKGNYVELCTKNDTYLYREKLINLEDKLNIYGFIRIHKSFIVNSFHIVDVGKNYVLLRNNTKIPFYYRKRNEIINQYVKHLAKYF